VEIFFIFRNYRSVVKPICISLHHLNFEKGDGICLRNCLHLRTRQLSFSTMTQQPPVGQGLLIIEDSPSHSDTPHSVGLLRTSDQPMAQTSTWQHITITTDRHPSPRRVSNPQSQQLSGHSPTP